MSSGKRPNRDPSAGAAYPTPEPTPAPEIPNWGYSVAAQDQHPQQPAAQGSTTEHAQNSNGSHSKSATPGSEQPATSEGPGQPVQNVNQARAKSATPAPQVPNWGHKATVEDESSEQPATSEGLAQPVQTPNEQRAKSATPAPNKTKLGFKATVEDESSEQPAAPKSTTKDSSEQPAPSGSSAQQGRNLNDPHSTSATPGAKHPTTSTTNIHQSKEPDALPDPDIPLPSIEDETGQEILYRRRMAAINHVLGCAENDLWAMLGLNPAHSIQLQAANTYRRLCFLVHPDKQEEEHKEKAEKAQAKLNQAKQSQGYNKALPIPKQPVTPEHETIPQPDSVEFRTGEQNELELRPLFAKPKKVWDFQEKFYNLKRILELVTQLSNSENPNYGYDQARMNLHEANKILLVTNIGKEHPADENLIDIDGLAAYFIRARLAREPETIGELRKQFEHFVKERHYPTAWIELIEAPPDVDMHTGENNLENTEMPDESDTSGEEEGNEEDSTDSGFKAGYTPLGEMIVAHRKVGRDGYQLLVATGHKACPFYQLRPASDYLRTVTDAYFECQHAKKLTNTPLQGQYKGILHWAEEYSRPGALKKPVGVGLVAFHGKREPEWAYRTTIEKFQKSRRGVDEAIELCKKREAKIRLKFYAKNGHDLPKPDYRQGLDERRQAKQRQDSNTFDPTSFTSFVCWWEKKNDVNLVKNPEKMSEMMGKWSAMQAAIS